MELVNLEWDGPVAIITLNRPKALNALNAQSLRELALAIAEVGSRADARALIVTGAGEKAFVAGADIAEMASFTPSQALSFSLAGQQVLASLEALKIPTLAAVNGFALGGGCELALACDFIYASEKARFALPEVTLAVIPGFGGTQRLSRLVGPARAKEMIFTGEMIDAAQAKQIGLALQVVPPEKLLAHCKEVAHTIAKRGPVAIAQGKRAIDRGADLTLAEGLELERQAFAVLFETSDQREGMQAFIDKRPAVFTGK